MLTRSSHSSFTGVRVKASIKAPLMWQEGYFYGVYHTEKTPLKQVIPKLMYIKILCNVAIAHVAVCFSPGVFFPDFISTAC